MALLGHMVIFNNCLISKSVVQMLKSLKTGNRGSNLSPRLQALCFLFLPWSERELVPLWFGLYLSVTDSIEHIFGDV